MIKNLRGSLLPKFVPSLKSKLGSSWTKICNCLPWLLDLLDSSFPACAVFIFYFMNVALSSTISCLTKEEIYTGLNLDLLWINNASWCYLIEIASDLKQCFLENIFLHLKLYIPLLLWVHFFNLFGSKIISLKGKLGVCPI